jgi:hypothetical protein
MLLELQSIEAVRWLRDLFLDVARASIPVDLLAQPGVDFPAIKSLVLQNEDKPPIKHLRRVGDGSFVWGAWYDEWQTYALMVDALLKGPGHQYFADDRNDDAHIEVSHAERHSVEN